MNVSDLSGKNVAVAGYGVENQALATFLSHRGARVTVLDQNDHAAIPDDYQHVVGSEAFENLDQFDVVFRTPGIRPDMLSSATHVSSSTQFFLEHFRDQTVAITGTKGKGTTCSLLYAMLQAAAVDSYLVGNIGVPSVSVWDKITPKTVIVHETSSFQLMDVSTSPHWAVCLMIEPDHLDWHTDMEEYVLAKAQISSHQTDEDVSIYFEGHELSQKAASGGLGVKKPYCADSTAHIQNQSVFYLDHEVLPVSDIGLIGDHNLQNVCAALTAFWSIADDIGLELETRISAARQAIMNFKGLEHRLEAVSSNRENIEFYNDSQATGVASALAAIDAFSNKPLTVIMGGHDKGINIALLAEELVQRQHIKHIALIGDTAPKLAQELNNREFNNFTVYDHGDFTQIIPNLITQLDGAGVVLLSPAFASFGLFDNYQQRGNRFKQAVSSL